MKYYLDVTRYNDDEFSFRTDTIPMNEMTLEEDDSLNNLICIECYRRKLLGRNKSISSIIYNGSEEKRDGELLFKTCKDDMFNINNLDTNLEDLISLINDVKECDGIYAYFDKNVNKEVTVKCLVESSKKKYTISEFKGVLRFASSRGYICIDDDSHIDMHIDFNSIYSIYGDGINYVNPFIGSSKINYQKYFTMLEESAFGKNESHTLKRRK